MCAPLSRPPGAYRADPSKLQPSLCSWCPRKGVEHQVGLEDILPKPQPRLLIYFVLKAKSRDDVTAPARRSTSLVIPAPADVGSGRESVPGPTCMCKKWSPQRQEPLVGGQLRAALILAGGDSKVKLVSRHHAHKSCLSTCVWRHRGLGARGHHGRDRFDFQINNPSVSALVPGACP